MEINNAIGQIDATTQQNAALVEEASAAAAAFQDEAARLVEVVGRFRIERAEPQAVPRPVRLAVPAH